MQQGSHCAGESGARHGVESCLLISWVAVLDVFDAMLEHEQCFDHLLDEDSLERSTALSLYVLACLMERSSSTYILDSSTMSRERVPLTVGHCWSGQVVLHS